MRPADILFRAFWPVFISGILLILFTGPLPAQTTDPVWADTTLAETLIKESRKLNREGDHTLALEKTRQSLAIYTFLYGDDHLKTARARMYVAREFRETGREQEAIVLIGRSLASYQANRDTFWMTLCHNNLSLCLRLQHRYAEAYQHIQTAIGLVRRDSAVQASLLADMHVTLGSILIDEKNYIAAIPELEEARAVYTVMQNARSLGEVSYHIGNAYFGLHDFVRAKENYLTAQANLKDQIKSDHSYFADLKVKIGLCCQKTGESETGLAYLLDAREAYLKLGTEDLNYIAFLEYLSQFYLDEKQYTCAIEEITVCLAAKEKLYGRQSPHLIGTFLILGKAYLQGGRFAMADACYRRGLRIATDSLQNDNKTVYHFYSKLAEIKFAEGDMTGCLSRCDTAFSVAGFDPAHPENMLPRDFFRELCQLYGQSLFQQFRHTGDTLKLFRAEQFFSLASETLYREVEEISVNSSREIFYDRDHLVLEQWLDASMSLFDVTANPAQAEAAFQIAGESKALLLAETMRKSGALRYAGVPDSILQAELSLRERIVTAEKTLHESGYQDGSQMDSTSLLLNRQLSYWREEYDELLRLIETDYPDYIRMRKLRRDISTRELRQKWLAPDQAILMYSLTQSGIYIFVLTRDTFCVTALPYDLSLDEDLTKFRKSLTEYFTGSDPNDALYDLNLETYIALAQSLYRKLVLPVAPLLRERVIIIPEGKLCYLPFEALLSGPPQDPGNFRTYPFWVRKKAVSYSLSPDFTAETSLSQAVEAGKEWLGMAPFAENTDSRRPILPASRNEHFLPLPFSGKEVNAIAALLGGEVWLGDEAGPGRLRGEASRYRILHLATHSRADDRLGDYSYLASSNTGELLPAKDIYQFSLAADMVVLSACEAGSGKLLRGEGVIGLVRAFMYAGARSVVASLWVANDQSTADLMIDFYRNLRKGDTKDRALQAARINLLDHAPAQANPFFWAGFRVYGNVAPLWH